MGIPFSFLFRLTYPLLRMSVAFRGSEDETSTQRSYRISRSINPMPQDMFFPRNDPIWYHHILSQYYTMDVLKKACEILGVVRKNGKKMKLVQRLTDRLHVLYLETDGKKFNSLVQLMNGLNRKRAWPGSHKDLFARYTAPKEHINGFDVFAKSRPFEFDVKIPKTHAIKKKLTGPVYFPALNLPSCTPLYIPLILNGHNPSGTPMGNMPKICLMVVRVYDTIKPSSTKQVKHRISHGNRVYRLSVNDEKLYHYGLHPSALKFIEITNLLKNGYNIIELQMKSNTTPYYFQVVEVVLEPQKNIGIQAGRNVLSSEEVKRRFISSQKTDYDDVSATIVKLSLRCPLSFARLEEPVRFNQCNHLQCFEMKIWNSFRPTHNQVQMPCPICYKKGRELDLIIDGFTKEILSKVSPNIDSINVDIENGFKWSIVSQAPVTDLINPPVDVLTVDDDDHMPDIPGEKMVVVESLKIIPQRRSAPDFDSDFVDLTTISVVDTSPGSSLHDAITLD